MCSGFRAVVIAGYMCTRECVSYASESCVLAGIAVLKVVKVRRMKKGMMNRVKKLKKNEKKIIKTTIPTKNQPNNNNQPK